MKIRVDGLHFFAYLSFLLSFPPPFFLSSLFSLLPFFLPSFFSSFLSKNLQFFLAPNLNLGTTNCFFCPKTHLHFFFASFLSFLLSFPPSSFLSLLSFFLSCFLSSCLPYFPLFCQKTCHFFSGPLI